MNKPQILVVEDEKIVALEIQDRLKNVGYEVPALISTGPEAIRLAGSLRPHLILMDIQLKGTMDGIAAAAEIRERYDIPVVFLTAYVDSETLNRAKKTEPYGYLLKPFDERELHTTIEMALYKSDMERRLKTHEQWLATTLRCIGDAVIATDRNGQITLMNSAAERLIGWTQDEALSKPLNQVFQVFDEATGQAIQDPVKKVVQRGGLVEFSNHIYLVDRNGQRIPIQKKCTPILDDRQEISGVVLIFSDISPRKQAERWQVFSAMVLDFLNRGGGKTDIIHELLMLIKEFTGMEAVGIRLEDQKGDFSYYEVNGFDSEFVQKEQSLCSRSKASAKELKNGVPLLDCLCGAVLQGRKKGLEKLFTDEGCLRVWNAEMAASVLRGRTRSQRIRGECFKRGYETVVLIPIRVNHEIIGLLQLNDRRPHNLSEETIRLLEGIGSAIGIAMTRKKVEEALRESEEHYRAVSDASIAGISITDESENLTFVNPAFAKMLGYTPEEMVGMNLSCLTREEEFKNYRKYTQERKKGHQGQYESVLVRKDGRELDVLVSVSSILLKGGGFWGGLAVVTDISERKNAEKALQDSEALLRSTIESTADGILVVDESGRTTHWNERFARMWRIPKSLFKARNDEKLLQFVLEQLERPDEFLKRVQELYGTQERSFDTLQFKDGRIFDRYSSPLVQNGKATGRVWSFRDVTEHWRMEENLRKSEHKFRTLFDSAGDSIFINDLDGRFLEVNRVACERLGYSHREWLKLYTSNLDSDEFKGKVKEWMDVLYRQGYLCYETVHVGKNKKTIPVEINARIIDYQGLPAVLSVARDISEQKQTREEIRRLKDFNESIVQNMAEGVLVGDSEGIIAFVNPAAGLLLGYRTEELIGKSWETVVPKDRIAMDVLSGELRKRNDIRRYEIGLMHRNGCQVPVLMGVSPRIEGSSFNGLLVVFTDITEIKKVEKEIERRQNYLASVLHSAPDAIITLDPKNSILEWNPGAEQIFGYGRDEVIGKNIDEIVAGSDDLKGAKDLTKRVREGEKVMAVEAVRYRKDHTPVNVMISGSPLQVGNEWFGVVAMYTDITKQKTAEEELKKAKETTEQMNDELKMAIERSNMMAVEAELANKIKSEFLANMSHEIRTPMNGIIGMTELACGTPLSSVQKEYLDAVKISAGSLLKLLNDILDFSKIEAGKLEMELVDFNLRDMLGDTVQTLALRADEKKLELICRVAPDVPDGLIGDPDRLRQIIINLISNAVKFTAKGEIVIDVALEARSENRTMLHFTVIDTGIGVPPDKQKDIFEAFMQADNSVTRRYGGTGLGLTISARLVTMMGGKIWVESPVKDLTNQEGGVGSAFHFTASMEIQPLPSVRTEPSIDFDLSGIPVLAVDDNATNRRILQEILSNWGMKPSTAESGETALAMMRRAAAAKCPYHLVILDACMPVMDGFDLAQAIKESSDLSDAVLVMLSSALRKQNMAFFENLSISAYLLKPVKQSELYNTLIEVMKSRIKKNGQTPVSGMETVGMTDSISEPSPYLLKILLAEDNAINRKLAETLLTKKGWNVVSVGDGEAAVQAFESEPFDLILMDVQMPKMDGLAATRIIRTMEMTKGGHMPIIAMTAHAMKGDREKCLEAGMDDYVPKPMKAKELYQAVDRAAAGQHRTVRQMDRKEEALTMSYDLNKILEAVDGDKELAMELTRDFLVEYPRQLNEIRQSIHTGNCEQLERKAHSFKGAVGNFGAETAYKLACELETVGRQSRIGEADQILNHLEKEMEQLKAYFSTIRWETNA